MRRRSWRRSRRRPGPAAKPSDRSVTKSLPDGLTPIQPLASENAEARAFVTQCCEILIAAEADLNALDAKSGDGDTGSTLATARALIGALDRLPLADGTQLYRAIGQELSQTMGGSSGVLLAIFFAAAGDARAGGKDAIGALKAGLERVCEVGGARAGRPNDDRCARACAGRPAWRVRAAAKAARAGADATAKILRARGTIRLFVRRQSRRAQRSGRRGGRAPVRTSRGLTGSGAPARSAMLAFAKDHVGGRIVDGASIGPLRRDANANLGIGACIGVLAGRYCSCGFHQVRTGASCAEPSRAIALRFFALSKATPLSRAIRPRRSPISRRRRPSHSRWMASASGRWRSRGTVSSAWLLSIVQGAARRPRPSCGKAITRSISARFPKTG